MDKKWDFAKDHIWKIKDFNKRTKLISKVIETGFQS